jgi:hypothetical protein
VAALDLLMPEEKAEAYRAYLLRCWREGEASGGEVPTWRFSVEEVLGERRRWGFGRLEEVVAFLQVELVNGEDEQT